MKTTAEKWGIRGVLDSVNSQRTQEPVDMRRTAVDVDPEPERLTVDEEAWAIHQVVAALRPLNGEARARVLQYIGQRFPAHKFED